MSDEDYDSMNTLFSDFSSILPSYSSEDNSGNNSPLQSEHSYAGSSVAGSTSPAHSEMSNLSSPGATVPILAASESTVLSKQTVPKPNLFDVRNLNTFNGYFELVTVDNKFSYTFRGKRITLSDLYTDRFYIHDVLNCIQNGHESVIQTREFFYRQVHQSYFRAELEEVKMVDITSPVSQQMFPGCVIEQIHPVRQTQSYHEYIERQQKGVSPAEKNQHSPDDVKKEFYKVILIAMSDGIPLPALRDELSFSDICVKTTKGKKADKLSRPPNSFLTFSNYMRTIVNALLSDYDSRQQLQYAGVNVRKLFPNEKFLDDPKGKVNVQNSALSKALSDFWNLRMNESDRSVFYDESKMLNRKFNVEYPHYKYQPERRKKADVNPSPARAIPRSVAAVVPQSLVSATTRTLDTTIQSLLQPESSIVVTQSLLQPTEYETTTPYMHPQASATRTCLPAAASRTASHVPLTTAYSAPVSQHSCSQTAQRAQTATQRTNNKRRPKTPTQQLRAKRQKIETRVVLPVTESLNRLPATESLNRLHIPASMATRCEASNSYTTPHLPSYEDHGFSSDPMLSNNNPVISQTAINPIPSGASLSSRYQSLHPNTTGLVKTEPGVPPPPLYDDLDQSPSLDLPLSNMEFPKLLSLYLPEYPLIPTDCLL